MARIERYCIFCRAYDQIFSVTPGWKKASKRDKL
jgi:hypothetical protein